MPAKYDQRLKMKKYMEEIGTSAGVVEGELRRKDQRSSGGIMSAATEQQRTASR